MKIFLIRHGETEWNQVRRYQGWTDIPLSGYGEYQARQCAQRMANEPVETVYVSDLSRAQRFAELAFPGVQADVVPELREIKFGILEGLTHQELVKQHPQVYQQWLKDPFKNTIPDAEDLSHFAGRVQAGWDYILSGNHAQTIAVVCHGGVNRVILSGLSGIDLSDIWKIEQHSAALNMIEIDNGGKGTIQILNDTSYYQDGSL